eukprot:TRINITY_DN816_c1_g1_i1.p1 TRINITY_DN816_c1_g1~~TRINITY_DN816_c1_g1_i1.p1  ORF type:complete len:765 (+),score=274.53 TRINITY_DN816_c1_g1_i1:185-2479(+)
MSAHQHRPTALHQSNKSHSGGKHSSKGAIKRKQGGKVEADTRVGVKKATKIEAKADKKSRQHQQNQAKKEAMIERRRFGTVEGAPKIVAMITLSEIDNEEQLKALILSNCGFDSTSNNNNSSSVGPTTVPLKKQRMTFMCVPRDIISVADISKVADILLLVVPAETEMIDDLGHSFISVIKAQGLPNVFIIVQGMDQVAQKKKTDTKKDLQKSMYFHFPDEPRILPLDSAEDAAQVVRFLDAVTLKAPHWREKRPYLLVDNVTADNDTGDLTTVKIYGYLRGADFSANQLVHLPGFGDFQLSQILGPADPNPTKQHSKFASMEGMNSDYSAAVLDSPTSQQESLQTENIPDLLANEQTWPTPEELASAGKKKKKIPKGMSEYQAAWIIDSDDDEDDDDAADDDDAMADDKSTKDNDMMSDEHDGSVDDEEEEDEDEDEDNEMMAEDKEKLDIEEKERVRKEREEQDFIFPDEVDCPLDTPARVRFQKYRGLKSFRTSEWDDMENLPLDYAKIFQFQNIKKSQARSMAIPGNVSAGTYVALVVKNVPRTYVQTYSKKIPRVVGGLFKYENKMSVLHFNVTKHHAFEETVPSKETLTYHVGFRRYEARGIFSALSPGCNKQKYEKFLMAGRMSTVSIYAPVSFSPSLVLMFKGEKLVATGIMTGVDPNKIIVKKIVLTGNPFKSHKRSSVVRDLFYFPEDAHWFKPVELFTKNGRTGHIKESVGTHGYLKCTFDDQVQQNDTVCMNLYKRVFPKWPTVSPSVQYQV